MEDNMMTDKKGFNLESALTQEYIKSTMVLHLAIVIGLISMAVIAVFLNVNAPENQQADEAFLEILTSLTIAVLAITLPFFQGGKFVFKAFIKNKLSAIPQDTPGREDSILAFIRIALILRLAVMEAPAYAGIVLCILAAVRGIPRENPLYWINMLPAVFLIGYVVINLPNRERISAMLKDFNNM
jgi:hypothetical protein